MKRRNVINLDKLLGPEKTIVQLKDFGTVKIKSFNLKDTIFALKLIKDIKDDKEFTIKLLHNQLDTKIELSRFQKISEIEFEKLGRQFINDRYYLSKNFVDSKNFFYDFRKAINIYLMNSFHSINSSLSSISGFNNMYAGFNPVSLNMNLSTIAEAAQRMKQAAIGTSLTMNKINALGRLSSINLVSFVNNLQLNSNIVKNVITPQVKIWEIWAQQNKSIFNNFNQNWLSFVDTYHIAIEEAINILKHYQWFVTSSLPPKFIFEIVKIGRKSGNQRTSINNHFYEYFSSDNFANLEELVVKWESDNIFRSRRIDIIKTCLSTIKNKENHVNTSFVIVPALIPQIDAIQTGFMRQKGLCQIGTRWKDQAGNNVGHSDFYKSQNFSKILDSAKDIFLNVLYQNTYPGQNLNSPIVFNRHKIMHGENLNYGTKYNSIRVFMILDFLAQIVNDNSPI